MLERLLDIGIKCGRLWEVQRFLSQVRTKQRDDNIQIIQAYSEQCSYASVWDELGLGPRAYFCQEKARGTRLKLGQRWMGTEHGSYFIQCGY